jgi:hypothetical protein
VLLRHPENKKVGRIISDFIALASQQSFTVLINVVIAPLGVKPPNYRKTLQLR